MKKTYRKPKMKPYNRADNQISALDYMYPGRKGYIALDEPEQQDMPGKCIAVCTPTAWKR